MGRSYERITGGDYFIEGICMKDAPGFVLSFHTPIACVITYFILRSGNEQCDVTDPSFNLNMTNFLMGSCVINLTIWGFIFFMLVACCLSNSPLDHKYFKLLIY